MYLLVIIILRKSHSYMYLANGKLQFLIKKIETQILRNLKEVFALLSIHRWRHFLYRKKLCY